MLEIAAGHPCAPKALYAAGRRATATAGWAVSMKAREMELMLDTDDHEARRPATRAHDGGIRKCRLQPLLGIA